MLQIPINHQNPYGIMGGKVPSARLDAAQAAEILGFKVHDVPLLITAKLLRPLGKPAVNAVKYFAAVEIYARFQDADWLHKATQKVYDHWNSKNARKGKSISGTERHPLETSLAI